MFSYDPIDLTLKLEMQRTQIGFHNLIIAAETSLARIVRFKAVRHKLDSCIARSTGNSVGFDMGNESEAEDASN